MEEQRSAAVPRTQPFYGRFARLARWTLRCLSPRYEAKVEAPAQPTIYVCRHLNMHGPYTTLKWLPFQVHPFSLSVFFDDETAIRHYREYTFSARRGKKAPRFSLRAWVLGKITVRLLRSFQAAPVFRDNRSISTIRQALKYLERGDSMIIWPDKAYTQGYDQPCELYSGFLYLGELYRMKTGRQLPFVPLYVDDEKRQIVERPAMYVNSYKTEKDEAARLLALAIDRRETEA